MSIHDGFTQNLESSTLEANLIIHEQLLCYPLKTANRIIAKAILCVEYMLIFNAFSWPSNHEHIHQTVDSRKLTQKLAIIM